MKNMLRLEQSQQAPKSLKLKTEAEITSCWEGNYNTPIVSIICITYNHEKFIEDAIKSFLTQKTHFSFEILVHDDASTDKTADIIRKYEQQYPKLIKPIYQAENQYSQGKMSGPILMKVAEGKYIAICEGDDYWADPTKLQQQYDLLENHKNINLCFHSAEKIDFYRNYQRSLIGKYGDTTSVITVNDIVLKPYGMIPTASVFARRSALADYNIFREKNTNLTLGDLYLQFFASYPNGAIYIDKPMSVYRYGHEVSWSSHYRQSAEFQVRHAHSIYDAFMHLNAYSNYEYDYECKMAILTNALNAYIVIKDSSFLQNYRFSKISNLLDNFIDIIDHQYDEVVVYGAGFVGKFLLQRLAHKVAYVVDAFEPSGALLNKNLINIAEFEGTTLPMVITVTGRCEPVKTSLQNFNLEIMAIDDYFISHFSDVFSA